MTTKYVPRSLFYNLHVCASLCELDVQTCRVIDVFFSYRILALIHLFIQSKSHRSIRPHVLLFSCRSLGFCSVS